MPLVKCLWFAVGVHEWSWGHERLFMPEGIITFMPSISFMNPVHTSLMIDHPLYAIILHIHTLKLPKIHEKPPFLLPVLPFLAAQNLPWNRWLDWNVPFKTGMWVVRVHTPGAKQRIFTFHFEVLKTKFSETSFYFYNQIYWAQNDPFWEINAIIYNKQSYLFLKMWPNIDYQPVLNGYLSPAVNQKQTRKSHNDVWILIK